MVQKKTKSSRDKRKSTAAGARRHTPTANSPNPLSISERLNPCLDKLGEWLVPPHEIKLGDDFAHDLQDEIGADAVSIFLTPQDVHGVLKYAAGSGYRQAYQSREYDIEGRPTFTTHVAKERKPFNVSLSEINKGVVPCSLECKEYIRTKRFVNVVGIPLMFENCCLGVLKVENKGDDPNRAFPPDDFEFLKVIGGMVGLSAQMYRYGWLWNEGAEISQQARTVDAYMNRLIPIVQRILNAECASAFLKKGADENTLAYVAGIGYQPEYEDTNYRVDDNTLGDTDKMSLTSYIVRTRKTVRKTREELETDKHIPYRGRCARHIGRPFRNILGVPICEPDNGPCFGVLKIENKLPLDAMFGVHDELIIQNLVRKQIVPTLAKLSNRMSREHTTGFTILKEKISNTDLPRRKLVRETERVRKEHDEVTLLDCVAFVGTSESTYRREMRAK